MAIISSSNLTTLVDNIAKSMTDLRTAFIANLGANAPTLTTITNGQNAASNSLRAHVASLNDLDQESALAAAASAANTALVSQLAISMNEFYPSFGSFMVALDKHVGGLNAFLVANSLQVNPEFASAFNYIAANAVLLGLAPAVLTQIAPANIFINLNQTLASVAVTGAAAGTFAAGTAIDTTKYGPAALFLKNTAGGATGGTATSFTVTFNNGIGNAAATATQALSGALAAGAVLAIAGASGISVSNIVVNSGGVAADAIAVVVQPLRTVSY
jgi:hypothetical protein